MTAETIIQSLSRFVIASQRVGAKRRPMTGSAKQSIAQREERMDCFAPLAMTAPLSSACGLEQSQ
jgi:hypothetical protein